ncbi:hypothetical protein CK503_00250 [Aliifodinibius salipaludis]|uniref:Uncharacterized protein n=1 Tax=Fodinibius salipaludis TaxID=2032627 RepID=A0A2A2GDB3_9BACT|nr:hypothetical protein [Aliifodinibius salipaludis]PAU95531.1 hypothetical protein CK503_00250 [Aliifodinibius salipaludis]
MNKRLFHSLTQQLKYEVFFVTDVGEPYHDSPNELKVFEFSYKGQQCKLVLNGSIELKTQQTNQEIESYQELLQGLMRSARKSTP